MADKFIPLTALRTIIDGVRSDLRQIRSIGTTTQQKIAAVNKREQYSNEYIVRETGKLREAAREAANQYVTAERTHELLGQVRNQTDYWTIRSYLPRVVGIADAGLVGDNNLARLQRITNLLLAAPRTTTDALGEAMSNALEAKDWPMLGISYNECLFRGSNDQAARALTASFADIDIPDITEALKLIAAGKQLEELIRYALNAVATGDEDIGLRREGYTQLWQEQQAAKQPHA